MSAEMPKRVQRQRVKGWRMPAGALYVGRPTKWGNPFSIASAIESEFATDTEHARRLVVECFDSWLRLGPQSPWWFLDGAERHATIRGDLDQLRGHDLACWCPIVDECGERAPCHADVLLLLANPEGAQ